MFCANAKISGEVWHIHEKEISLYYHLKKKQETQMKPKQVKQDILYSWESMGFPKLLISS